MKNVFKTLIIVLMFGGSASAQSVAMRWNQVLLQGIRNDFARPNVHARNLFHISAAMYDAWAAYDTLAHPFLLGKKVGNYTCTFHGVPKPSDLEKARETAISYATYRLIKHRFALSPKFEHTRQLMNTLCLELGIDTNYTSSNYSNGNPADLGNFIATSYINFGLQDGSNEQDRYKNRYYKPLNKPFYPELIKTPEMIDPNRWQQLGLKVFVDQSGNVIAGDIPGFLGPEWGDVVPFSMSKKDLKINNRDNHDWWVYHDPGTPPKFKAGVETDSSEFFKWAFTLVAVYGSKLSPHDGVMWDISPKAMRAPDTLPTTLDGYRKFYDPTQRNFFDSGYSVNPKTGLPYASEIVPRGDFTRALAEFWADGPDSETPPGHWFTLLNYVNSQPGLVRKFKGQYPIASHLEWDVKSYLMMGGAMHDCAISAWGVKAWYDYVRPISAIRYLTSLGQSSDMALPNYNISGVKLIPGFIELVKNGDPLAGSSNENINKIKLYSWKGHDFINNTATDEAGVGWILAEDWWPYQRPTFVTPPFAGYVSGHSTYSMAAATVLEKLTGDPYFPGGLGTYKVKKNEFLVFEEGPSVDFELQWATYKDAASQSGLSRIWGGIHPPIDDIPGRRMGIKIGGDAVGVAERYFYRDADGDGVLSHVDCNDNDATIYHGAPELCDNKDNDCNGKIDDGITYFTYFSDRDKDGFGSRTDSIVSCVQPMPKGYSLISGDCNDFNESMFPGATEVADNSVDEDCSGFDLTSKLVVWPNPFTNVLNGYKSGVEEAELVVYDRIGQLVFSTSKKLYNGRFQLDLEFLIPGTYVLSIHANTGESWHRLIVRN